MMAAVSSKSSATMTTDAKMCPPGTMTQGNYTILDTHRPVCTHFTSHWCIPSSSKDISTVIVVAMECEMEELFAPWGLFTPSRESTTNRWWGNLFYTFSTKAEILQLV